MTANPARPCHQIFPDAHQCGSPALRGEAFCYYHHPDRKPVSNPYARRARRGFTLPTPDTPEALQIALYSLIDRIASNQVDVHRAGLLLYSLQLAGNSMPSISWEA